MLIITQFSLRVGPDLDLDLEALVMRGINMEYRGGTSLIYKVTTSLILSSHLISHLISDPPAAGHSHHLLQREGEHGGEQERAGGQSSQQEGGADPREVGSQVSGRSLQEEDKPPAAAAGSESERLPGPRYLGQHSAPLGHQDAGQSAQ